MGRRHLKFRVEGLIGANQSWSVNPTFFWDASSIPTQASLDAWVDAWAAQSAGDFLPSGTMVSGAVSVVSATASYIDDSGKTDVISKAALTTPVTGSGDPKMPPQAALVSTLQTNIAGRSGRGRLYWPCLGATLDTTSLRITTTAAQSYANAVASWIHGIGELFSGSTTYPVVASGVKSALYPITSVRVGTVVDTQRRRRDQFQEQYAVADVPA